MLNGFDPNTFIIGFLFSTIGVGYFIYGKKNQKNISLFSGLILMIYPIFIEDFFYLILIGIILIILPFLLRR